MVDSFGRWAPAGGTLIERLFWAQPGSELYDDNCTIMPAMADVLFGKPVSLILQRNAVEFYLNGGKVAHYWKRIGRASRFSDYHKLRPRCIISEDRTTS